MAWAHLAPEPEEPAVAAGPAVRDDGDASELTVHDDGPVTAADRLINTRGSSLNYTLWEPQALAPFCADKSSLKGED